MRLSDSFFIKSPTFFHNVLINYGKKWLVAPLLQGIFFRSEAIYLLSVNTGAHVAYQNFVVENLRKYYQDPDSIPRSTWNIIEHFWMLDFSFTDTYLKDKYRSSVPNLALLHACIGLICFLWSSK